MAVTTGPGNIPLTAITCNKNRIDQNGITIITRSFLRSNTRAWESLRVLEKRGSDKIETKNLLRNAERRGSDVRELVNVGDGRILGERESEEKSESEDRKPRRRHCMYCFESKIEEGEDEESVKREWVSECVEVFETSSLTKRWRIWKVFNLYLFIYLFVCLIYWFTELTGSFFFKL